MKIIAGLGNPGEKYKNTRHNVGFMLLDFLVEKKGLNWKQEKKFNAFTCKDNDTIYIKPLTFMNESGISIKAFLSYYKLFKKNFGIIKKANSNLSQNLIVVHDEIDIEFGKIKNSINRGPAGHNGIKSIIDNLKTKNFSRLRVGVKGEHFKKGETEKYVLSKFNKFELDKLYKTIFPSIEL